MIRRLTVAVLSLIPVVAGFELLLRLGIPENPKHWFEESQRSWKESSHRVLILGDSFIEPGGELAPLLKQGLGEHDVAVRNLALGGTGPFEYLERLRSFIDSHEEFPTVVLLSYYVGNDLTDVQNNPKYDASGAGVAIRTLVPELWRLESKSWLDALYLTHFVRKHRKPVPPPQKPKLNWKALEAAGYAPERIDDARNSRMNSWLFALSKSNPNYLLDNILMETEENLAAWERVKVLLSRISKACSDRNAQLLVVAFPRSVQLDRSHFEFFEGLKFNVDSRLLGCMRPQELLADYCEQNRVPLLDLWPEFVRSNPAALYRERDDHLNATGNQLAADLILPWVHEQLD